MKRELIDFFNTDLQFIKGVGPVLATRLNDILGGRRVLDFLLHTFYCTDLLMYGHADLLKISQMQHQGKL